MNTITVQVYSACELKHEHPHAFAKAYEKYKEGEYNYGLNWGDEMFQSLKALIELGGYKMTRYSLGDSSCRDNHIQIDKQDCDGLSGKRAMAWLENNILSKLRDKKGQLDAGKLTGYCLDYTLVESLQESIRTGSTIREAFTELVTPYVAQVDSEWEDQLSEERFLDTSDANNVQFFEDGRRV